MLNNRGTMKSGLSKLGFPVMNNNPVQLPLDHANRYSFNPNIDQGKAQNTQNKNQTQPNQSRKAQTPTNANKISPTYPNKPFRKNANVKFD